LPPALVAALFFSLIPTRLWAESPSTERPQSAVELVPVLPPFAPLMPCPPEEEIATPPQVVARVNGEPILQEDLLAAAYRDLLTCHDADKPKILRSKLNEIIDRELVLQFAFELFRKVGAEVGALDLLSQIARLRQMAADDFDNKWLAPMMQANKYTDKDSFERFLCEQSFPLAAYRRAWERNYFLRELLGSLLAPMEDEVGLKQIVEYYRQHDEEFRIEESVTWQDLFVAATLVPSPLVPPICHLTWEAARKLAESLAGRLRRGEDFSTLSKRYNDGESALRQGEGVGKKHGEIRPVEAEAVLFRMKEGDVALVELSSGVHVVKLLHHQRAGKRPLDYPLQIEIVKKLRGEVYKREVKRLVAELRRRAVIDRTPSQMDEVAERGSEPERLTATQPGQAPAGRLWGGPPYLRRE
jgi:hypothetical protein